MQKIVGIDPGLDGAIVTLQHGHLEFFPMPTFKISTPIKKPKKAKPGKKQVTHKHENHIDVVKLVKIFDQIDIKNCKVVIEDILAFFGMGKSSAFKMGYSLGMIHSQLDIMATEYELIKPGKWQKAIWIEKDMVKRENPDKATKQSRTDTKATSIKSALRLYPRVNFCKNKNKKPHDGLVDATLIAHYGSL